MSKLLHYVSLLCCAFVIVSFFLFAMTQTSHASQSQATAVATGAISVPRIRTKPIARESQPRRLIDQVARQLNAPFTGIIATSNRWMARLLPTLCSLLVYGLALSFLARWAAGRPA